MSIIISLLFRLNGKGMHLLIADVKSFNNVDKTFAANNNEIFIKMKAW